MGWKTNGLARNRLDFQKIVEELNGCNVKFESCSEHFDITGCLMMNELALQA